MSAIIKVENLGKKYILAQREQERYTALRDVMAKSAKRLGSRLLSPFRPPAACPEEEEFWALQEVSFEIHRGDRVGIIGRNGAGKSTLLKILSRITEPTTGKVIIRGRVASLLEVGTGFHPELTGRENIYLNGSILGMSREEIRRKFAEIVDFAEVEKFLDTPVKRYSSGMYVRLAFAVAAHLDPDILIVDEVLAVGDAQFQKKCLGKMKDVTQGGKTILFVSHNMNAVETLCTSAMMLDRGRLVRSTNDIPSLIKAYLFDPEARAREEWRAEMGRCQRNDWVDPLRLRLADADGRSARMPFGNDEEVWVEIEVDIKLYDPALCIGYALYNEDGIMLYWSYHTDRPEAEWPRLDKGKWVLRSKFPSRLVNEGTYRLELLASLHFRQWLYQPGHDVPGIQLSIQGGLSDSPYWIAKRPGILGPVLEWAAEPLG